MDRIQRIASLEPGDPIPHTESVWIIEAFRTYSESGGDLPLDICFGVRRDDSPRSARQRRNFYLCRAYAEFRPEKNRVNTNRVLQFSRAVKAFRNTYCQHQRTGRLPSGQFDLYLYLAFDSGRVPTSESQLRRILQPF